MSIEVKEMKNKKLYIAKKVFFYILLVLIGSWLILSIASIFSYAHPTSSAPWYTGIVVFSLMYAIPVALILTIYLILTVRLNKNTDEQ